MVKCDVGRKYTRGVDLGSRFVTKIKLDKPKDIYKIIWDTVLRYDREQVDYIIEWYRIKDK